jgi:hypothetical protein
LIALASFAETFQPVPGFICIEAGESPTLLEPCQALRILPLASAGQCVASPNRLCQSKDLQEKKLL